MSASLELLLKEITEKESELAIAAETGVDVQHLKNELSELRSRLVKTNTMLSEGRVLKG